MSKPVFKRRHLVDFPPFPQNEIFYSISWLYCTPCQFRKGINSTRKDFAFSYRVDPFFLGGGGGGGGGGVGGRGEQSNFDRIVSPESVSHPSVFRCCVYWYM